MTSTRLFETQAKSLIDDLKAVCANAGLGNDGNEFKIITQIFLYKFLNDKFAYEAKQIDPKLAKADSWEDALRAYSKDDYEMLLAQLGGSTAQLKPGHFLAASNRSSKWNLFAVGESSEHGLGTITDSTLGHVENTANGDVIVWIG